MSSSASPNEASRDLDGPPDSAERKRICTDLDSTLLVEAAAGTGKTTCMVRRMVALLREGRCQIDTLAAVTFTRKSAAELRSRFQIELERSAADASSEARRRLVNALAHVDRCFIGTIHSFCGRLLRERPIEAGVDLEFVELDDAADEMLREAAWQEYVARAYAENDPVIDEVVGAGLEIGQLQEAFNCMANYPDVDQWPAPEAPMPDVAVILSEIDQYAAHMEGLSPTFPSERGNDKLMSAYEIIPRHLRQIDRGSIAEAMGVVARFKSLAVVQRNWPEGAAQGRGEQQRWNSFVTDVSGPLLDRWLAQRYAISIRAARPALAVYDQLRREARGLNFQDLLQRAAALLTDKPAIRDYFRKRFTHLLVDEFQDTDPIQAEVMLLLTADDRMERNWKRCRPVPGSLFVVGDPKQSIYRFRRADIVVYNDVKRIILESGGAVVPLSTNFRSVQELIQWGNAVFDRMFPATADDFSPAACAMHVGRRATEAGQLHGLHQLHVPAEHATSDAARDYEADFVARTIRHAIDSRLSLSRTSEESADGASPHATAGDFLIVTRSKKRLASYAQRLSELGVPHEVTGGKGLQYLDELKLLAQCLRAITEPDNPVALLAVLRGDLFGVSDRELYAFRKRGGVFDYRRHSELSLPDSAPRCPVREACGRLHQYQRWMRQWPTMAAVERMVADLGLSVRAAAGGGDGAGIGNFYRAIEVLRSAYGKINSVAGLTRFLLRMLESNEEFDGMPLKPHGGAAVRLMNLHKVKGLEASVVFLAEPAGDFNHGAQLHVDRTEDQVRGYMKILDRASPNPAGEFRSRPVIACPFQSERLFDTEKQFQEAEEHRLLYVAATRARSSLIVVQRAKGNHANPWRAFAPFLEGQPMLGDCGPQARLIDDVGMLSGAEVDQELAQVAARWRDAAAPTYAVAAAKRLALTPSAIHFDAKNGEGGAAWGTVIHLLLQAAISDPGGDLRPLAQTALEEEGLDPARADDALEVIHRVAKSEIYGRARNSDQCLTEVPFQKMAKQGDPASHDGLPTIIRGVIDLVFREPSGWVIVDYKTDRISSGQIDDTVAHYRDQLDAYAGAWNEMVHAPVVEQGLYFTHLDQYVIV